MKNFHCDNCGMVVFFENDHCEKCGEELGFSPQTLEMISAKKWQAATSPQLKKCANYVENQVCNWLVTDADQTFCRACRLNQTIPDLTVAGNVERWRKLELAKRRCLYIYLRLGLPIELRKNENRQPLVFRFMPDTPGAPVLTGHDQGVITINVAEADEDERERRRLKFHEPYRTLVGHFRHESGHYYWDRLVADSDRLAGFRELFGDETLDYGEAMKNYYQNGPAPDWQERMVTPYASWHPWEDWAETWAHYLHMVDTMETAAAFGVGLNQLGHENEAPKKVAGKITARSRDFDQLFNDWQPLPLALNAINRAMGLPDLYPFVIPQPAIDKLRFIHDLIEEETGDGASRKTESGKAETTVGHKTAAGKK